MGGGGSTDAVMAHMLAGWEVSATPAAARTIHNDLSRVEKLGVRLTETAGSGAETIHLQDIDLDALSQVLHRFGIEMPATVAVAVQDHGYRPGSGNNEVRFEFLQQLLADGGAFSGMVYLTPPTEMIRMEAVARTVPGCYLMDTGAAAVLGAMGDPLVARHVERQGAILVNCGNMHTFATLVKGRRLLGLFEHHTGGITAGRIEELVNLLQRGELDAESFARDYDGHGAAVDPGYAAQGPFEFVAITGPNRGLARGLGYHEAAPHGDMMLTGAFGLVAGALLAEGIDPADVGLFAAP